jgi:hypothetical protein
VGEYVPEMTRNAYDQVIESSVASASDSGKHSENESSSEDSEVREKSHLKKRHGRARELMFSPSSMLRELIKQKHS